jgi:hypothetical protein
LPAGVALALTLLVIAACAGPKEPVRDAQSDAAAPIPLASFDQTQEPAAAKPLSEKTPPPDEVRQAELTDPEIELPFAPVKKSERPPINDDPHQLMGLAPHAVNRLLGPPSLLRTEAPAEVWQYIARDCVLDIFLYAEEHRPHRSRVTYYEIRLPETAESGARACFAEIIESRMSAADTPLER